MLTLNAANARIVYAYGRHSNKFNEAFPARETIAHRFAVSERSVSRALSAAVDAGLLTRHERKRGFKSPVFTRCLPDGVGQQVRPKKNREDRSVQPSGQICHAERTEVATKENPVREPKKRTIEESSMKTDDYVGKDEGAPAASTSSNEQLTSGQFRGALSGGWGDEPMEMDRHGRRYDEPLENIEQLPSQPEPIAQRREDGLTSAQMHEVLHREPKRPGQPAKLTVTHNLEEISEVDEATHLTAYKAATGHFWQARYNPWLFQFIAFMTLEQHKAWMARLFARGANQAGMVLQTMIVQDILDGRARPKFEKRVETGVAFGTGGDDIDWGGDDSGVAFGTGGWE